MAVQVASPNRLTVSLAMLPSLAGLGCLLLPTPQLTQFGLAAALALHWLWDARAPGLPAWYGTLRGLLTAGAVTGLIAGARIMA
jgi:hypothetical protein